jgi:hypothetical protein
VTLRIAEADSHQRPLNLVADWEGISFGDGESDWIWAAHWFPHMHHINKNGTNVFGKPSL